MNPEDRKIKTKYPFMYFLKCWEKEKCWFTVLIPEQDTLNKKRIETFLSHLEK